MKIWQLIEAIDDPSGLVHQERHQAFATGQHPLGRHPAYPEFQRDAEGSAENYEEMLASKQWQKILQKAQRYLGVPLSRQSLPLIQRKTVEALRLIQQAESQKQEELQNLAIELVFTLPEFKTARQAYEDQQIVIDANLVSDRSDLNTDDMMTSDEPEAQAPLNRPEKQRTPAEQEWMQKTVQRRHFTNAMIQGSAVSNDFLFELAGEALDRIHPGLRNAYGILMVATEIGYWIFPQSMVLQGAKDKTHVGVSQVRRETPEDQPEGQPGEEPPQSGRPVVVAQGACFPVLIQEIIKGLTELASLSSMAGLPNDPDDRQEVLNKTDLTDMEAWHMLLGPKLWDSFIEAVDAENERELTFHLYSAIQRMDNDKFNTFMREVLGKTPTGMRMLRDLATQIKGELAGDEGGHFEEAQEIVRQIIEGD